MAADGGKWQVERVSGSSLIVTRDRNRIIALELRLKTQSSSPNFIFPNQRSLSSRPQDLVKMVSPLPQGCAASWSSRTILSALI